ncbi:MFS transporter [Streptomyces chartreusis]|uniref:MFS transporter n=1 Tax=Streptomyces chartreusis TaxID=1969 RepID=UPI003653A5BB
MSSSPSRLSQRSLALVATICAVAMTFIDQTILSIAAPTMQGELHLTTTDVQWAVNAYVLALAALFSFGGRLADTVGHRRMLVVGVATFAVASALCGMTPAGPVTEPWLITFRALQGAGGALLYPAALAIVASTYAHHERGRGLALFFGIAGGLTAIGPVLGGYLTQWTWRAIFWVNVPLALIALLLIAWARPQTFHRPAPMDYKGLALIAGGTGLSVFGFQQASLWGWSLGTWLCITAGVALLVWFARAEARSTSPLLNIGLFRDRTFLVQNLVLLVAMATFVPVTFFTSAYAEVALGMNASRAGRDLLYFFFGFVVAAQVGGRLLDRAGAKRPVVLGSALASGGYFLWADRLTTLDENAIVWCMVMAGAGMGLMLGQSNTDALNRVPQTSYGEATGATQTVRNYGASLGLAVLGTQFASALHSRLTSSLTALGLPHDAADWEAAKIARLGPGTGGSGGIPHVVRLAFAEATQAVMYSMGTIMAVACAIALVGLRTGTQRELPAAARGEKAEAVGARPASASGPA